MADLASLFAQNEITPQIIDEAPKEKLNVGELPFLLACISVCGLYE